MRDTLKNKDAWCTPALMEKVMKNPNLAKAFSNPEIMQAIKDMQTDPKGTQEKYGQNPEF